MAELTTVARPYAKAVFAEASDKSALAPSPYRHQQHTLLGSLGLPTMHLELSSHLLQQTPLWRMAERELLIQPCKPRCT